LRNLLAEYEIENFEDNVRREREQNKSVDFSSEDLAACHNNVVKRHL